MLIYLTFYGGIAGPVLKLSCLDMSSVKHSYEGEWNDNNSLSTCDLHSKFTTTYSVGPQEVEDKNEIIFTYDVDFQVRITVENFAGSTVLFSM